MIRAALYARYSSDLQREASIEDQFRICRDHAEKAGWSVGEAYRDAAIYARKVARLAKALEKPDERDAAASAIRGLIERIVLTPDADGLHVTLKGDFGAILEWTGNGDRKETTDTLGSRMSVSMVGSGGRI